jgi:hypothetical protein
MNLLVHVLAAAWRARQICGNTAYSFTHHFVFVCVCSRARTCVSVCVVGGRYENPIYVNSDLANMPQYMEAIPKFTRLFAVACRDRIAK